MSVESKVFKVGTIVSLIPAGTRATMHNLKVIEIHPFGFFAQQPHKDAPVLFYNWQEVDALTIPPVVKKDENATPRT
jgi:ureidoglycolate hydrolase